MIFLDTWIWLEFLFRGRKFETSRKLLQLVKTGKEKAVISSLVLAEIKYQVEKRFGAKRVEEVIFSIESFPNLKIAAITPEIAKLGANLRNKYYKKPIRLLSYADCINLATAIIEGCDTFFTGDKEFKGIEEIKIKIV